VSQPERSGDSMTHRVVILGAAGRDFHNFNVCFRDDPRYHVVAFTATQIPEIAGRRYPPELAGRLYPDGIPIVPEEQLEELIAAQRVDLVVFAYSDVSNHHVMQLAARANAAGADFLLLSPERTMLPSRLPVISVCAVRTGCGKSPVSRRVVQALRDLGKQVVVVRHPMPYGDLTQQRLQRFATMADLDRYRCTIEEREEYEPHLRNGTVVYAGVDYEAILAAAEQEAEILLWDGGNNDTPFFRSDLEIVVADPHRPGHELTYYPGAVNLRRAHVVVLNKVDTARPEDVETVRRNISRVNPNATILETASRVEMDRPELVRGARVLVIEDGPTVTHGEMPYGAGVVAARQGHAAQLVDPRPYLVGSLKTTFQAYPHLGALLPAMGYSAQQLNDLQATIRQTPCDVVLVATPVDLSRLIEIPQPVVRVRYEVVERGELTLADVVRQFVAFHEPVGA